MVQLVPEGLEDFIIIFKSLYFCFKQQLLEFLSLSQRVLSILLLPQKGSVGQISLGAFALEPQVFANLNPIFFYSVH